MYPKPSSNGCSFIISCAFSPTAEKEYNGYEEGYEEKDGEKLFLEGKLREFFESSVEIKGNLHGNGKIEIKFHDYEELERIIGLLDINFD